MTTQGDRGRLPVRSSADTDGETQRVLGKLEQSGNDLMVLRALANSPQMLRPFVLFADALLNRAALPARVREFMILALAAEQQVAYEWTEHVRISAAAGVTAEEREALTAGLSAEGPTFDDEVKLGLRATAELHASRTLSDQTWDDLCSTWGEAGALDAILTIGWWGSLVPRLIGALRVTHPDDVATG